MTSSPFLEQEKEFERLCKRAARKRPGCRLLDIFAGVGTTAVVLKKLGIKIDHIVHVEYDKVANHVFMSNHYSEYPRKLPKHNTTWVQDFETLSDCLDDCMETYGREYLSESPTPTLAFLTTSPAFNLLVGGPPCQDFTGINAKGQGTVGPRGRYMLDVADLIKKIQNHPRQQGVPLFFLIENVKPRKEDMAKIQAAYGFDYDVLELDAKSFSPAMRKRIFITNIGLSKSRIDKDDYEDSCFSSCLDDDYRPGMSFREESTTVKSRCFMASKGRLDDERMLVYKKDVDDNGDFFWGRTITARERERIMGFPEGYVTEAVKSLFETLFKQGFETEGTARERRMKKESKECENPQFCWSDMPRMLRKMFAGAYHYIPNGYKIRFAWDEGPVPVLMLTPPFGGRVDIAVEDEEARKSLAPVFLTHEEYAKRLIGNVFSIPVVERLLEPLQSYFARESYDDYNYKYAWQSET